MRNPRDLIIPVETREGVSGAIKPSAESGYSIPSGELSLQRKDGTRVSGHSNHAIIETAGRGRELNWLDVDLTEINRGKGELHRIDLVITDEVRLHGMTGRSLRSFLLANRAE